MHRKSAKEYRRLAVAQLSNLLIWLSMDALRTEKRSSSSRLAPPPARLPLPLRSLCASLAILYIAVQVWMWSRKSSLAATMSSISSTLRASLMAF